MKFLTFIAILFMMSPCTASDATAPLPRLQTGNELRVDANTNRITIITSQGESYMLPDGVHHLENGAVIRVRNGIMLPDKQLMETRQPPQPQPATADLCKVLQRQSCGLSNQCRTQESCELARQLTSFFRDSDAFEKQRIEKQCAEALTDNALFTPCPMPKAISYQTQCKALATRVCGSNNQCGNSEPCNMARQLVAMELRERLGAWNPDVETWSTMQCQKAFDDNIFFVACTE